MDQRPGDRLFWFQLQVMIPTVEEFRADPGSSRRGLLAALVVNQCIDYIFHECAPERRRFRRVENYRGELCSQNAALALVRDVANAAKHVRLERGTPLINGIDAVGFRRSVISGPDDPTTEYGPVEIAVYVEGQPPRRLLDTVEEAMNFLTSMPFYY